MGILNSGAESNEKRINESAEKLKDLQEAHLLSPTKISLLLSTTKNLPETHGRRS